MERTTRQHSVRPSNDHRTVWLQRHVQRSHEPVTSVKDECTSASIDGNALHSTCGERRGNRQRHIITPFHTTGRAGRSSAKLRGRRSRLSDQPWHERVEAISQMDAGAPAPCAGQEPSTICEMACRVRHASALLHTEAPPAAPRPGAPPVFRFPSPASIPRHRRHPARHRVLGRLLRHPEAQLAGEPPARLVQDLVEGRDRHQREQRRGDHAADDRDA